MFKLIAVILAALIQASVEPAFAVGYIGLSHTDDSAIDWDILFLPMVGAAVGFVWGSAKNLQSWVGISTVFIAGALLQVVINAVF